jgi:DNA-binding HxlR family transcriptional regulator
MKQLTWRPSGTYPSGKQLLPYSPLLDVIGDWWSLLIVRDALRGVRRFSEFQKNLGIAKICSPGG